MFVQTKFKSNFETFNRIHNETIKLRDEGKIDEKTMKVLMVLNSSMWIEQELEKSFSRYFKITGTCK